MIYKTMALITAIIEFIGCAILIWVAIDSFVESSTAFCPSTFIWFGIGCIALTLFWGALGFINIKIYKEEE